MELLRDVLRTDDAAGRTRRRWLLFPISAALHVSAAVAYLAILIAAEVTLPAAAAPSSVRRWVVSVAPPGATPEVVRRLATASPSVAPIEAPSRIAPEVPAVPDVPAPAGAIDGPPGLTAGVPDGFANLGSIPPPPPPPDVVTPERPSGPVRIGGDVRAPQRLVATPPVYPAAAIAARIEGRVILEALIDERGRVSQVKVMKSVPLLDAAALDAVRSWRYTPTRLNGVAVPVLMTVTVTFALQR